MGAFDVLGLHDHAVPEVAVHDGGPRDGVREVLDVHREVDLLHGVLPLVQLQPHEPVPATGVASHWGRGQRRSGELGNQRVSKGRSGWG